MGFFGGRDEAKDQPKNESQRLKIEKGKKPAIKSFVVGLALNEKLANVADERLEEGLKAALPKGSKVQKAEGVALDAAKNAQLDADLRFFQVTVPSELADAVGVLSEKGLIEGQLELTFEQCVVVLRANGRLSGLTGAVDWIDRFSFKYEIRCETQEVYVQYPPLELHRRWLADDDYRAAYARWRAQRCEEMPKLARWHQSWSPASTDESGPPWIRLRSKEGKPDEHTLEFDERVLVRFGFQGAEINIMRFNLKVLSNKLTNEFAVYRSLPLTLESLPKDVQDRMNRDPERFRPVREPGKFGQHFDLVRQAYEELGGDYFQIESPPVVRREEKPVPLPTSNGDAKDHG